MRIAALKFYIGKHFHQYCLWAALIFNSLKNFPIAFPSISNSMLYLGVSFRTTLEKHHFLPPILNKEPLFYSVFDKYPLFI